MRKMLVRRRAAKKPKRTKWTGLPRRKTRKIYVTEGRSSIVQHYTPPTGTIYTRRADRRKTRKPVRKGTVRSGTAWKVYGGTIRSRKL